MAEEIVTAFKALALQLRCESINAIERADDARHQMAATLDRIEQQLAQSLLWLGKDTKLVVLPEYFLTGFPMGESIEAWRDKACLAPGGSEYERLGAIAKRFGIFLSGNAYELDENFPDLYFQASFIVDPHGDVVLRYRRLNSMFAPTPHDVWDKYLDIYGIDGVFPVARTDIGNLATIASEEILYPEVARSFAVRGAEVFLHSSSEASSPRPTPKSVARTARAIENLAYVVSANSAGIAGIDIPFSSTDGYSAILDFRGTVLAEAAQGESIVAASEIDIGALRRYRRRPGMDNYLSRQRLELFADTYSREVYPKNSFAERPPERSHFVATQKSVIERLSKHGLI